MASDIKQLKRQLENEMPKIENKWQKAVSNIQYLEGERATLKQQVDSKLNVHAFQELDQLDSWLSGSSSRDTFKFYA